MLWHRLLSVHCTCIGGVEFCGFKGSVALFFSDSGKSAIVQKRYKNLKGIFYRSYFFMINDASTE